MILAVDPGVVTLGAVWYPHTRRAVLPYHVYSKVLRNTKKLSAEEKANAILHCLQAENATVVRRYQKSVSTLVIEKPILFRGSVGHAVASGGGLVDLAAAYGQIVSWAFAMGMSVVPLEVNVWKGQLPKNLVQRRTVLKYINPQMSKMLLDMMAPHPSTHHWDALGLALYHGEST